MVFIPGVSKQTKKTSGFIPGGIVSTKKSVATGDSLDVSTLDGLENLARMQGVELPKKEKKLSFLQRLTRGLSALEPANAFFEAKYEGQNFAKEYVKDIFLETGAAITGKEFRKERKRTFKDILVKEGMKDREGNIDLADVAGLAGDILTDPSTFFGGAIAKGIGKTVKGVGKVGLGVSKIVAPKTTARGIQAFDAAKDAFGKAFTYGYGTSAGLSDNVVEYINKVGGVKSKTGQKYAEMFKGLSKESQDDLVEGLFRVRKQFGQTREMALNVKGKFFKKKILQQTGQINKELRALKVNYKTNSQVVSQIETLQKKLADEQADLLGKTSEFISGVGKKIPEGVTPFKKPTIVPMELLPEASIANKFDDLEDFLASADSIPLEKKVLTGEMESFGFGGDIEQSLGKFWSAVKGVDYKLAKETEEKIIGETVQKTTAGVGAIAKQKERIKILQDGFVEKC